VLSKGILGVHMRILATFAFWAVDLFPRGADFGVERISNEVIDNVNL
jgi:hypothetical protein